MSLLGQQRGSWENGGKGVWGRGIEVGTEIGMETHNDSTQEATNIIPNPNHIRISVIVVVYLLDFAIWVGFVTAPRSQTHSQEKMSSICLTFYAF